MHWPNKTIIGLTGNIATGKSTIMRLAAQRGAHTLDADRIVHEILDHDVAMQAAIAVAFGPEVRLPDGPIDRAALGAIVFQDPEALHDLELMLHPAVRREVYRRVNESQAQIVILEAIKLLEGELVTVCDEIWVTACSREVQIERLRVCRGMTPEAAAQRVDGQNPQAEKVARAHVVIETDGTMAETEAQFERAWRRLTTAGTTHLSATQAQDSTLPVTSQIESDEVTVRRARPSDVPGILLFLHRATEGAVRMTRAELLAAYAERSYLIGQRGEAIQAVLGWSMDSTTAACIDRVYVHPLPEATDVLPAALAEVEYSAQALLCEVVIVFLPENATGALKQAFAAAGYAVTSREELRRAWRRAAEEIHSPDSVLLLKVLRDVRAA